MTYNPVEQRILQLAESFCDFQDNPSLRLLIWQANDNARRFYQGFFEVQKHETDLSVGSLFILFDAPFHNSLQYSRVLKESLAGQHEASLDVLKAQGIDPSWSYSPGQFQNSVFGFIQSLLSFGSAYHHQIGHLVAALMPSAIEDTDAFCDWVDGLTSQTTPERLRFVVVDSLNSPQLSRLVESSNPKIWVDQPKIDGLIAAQETFAQEKTVGPGGVFRNFLTGLMALVETGAPEEVLVKAGDALQFARTHKWLEQEFVIRMLVAGAFLKANRLNEALNHYQHARKTAQVAVSQEIKIGRELELQALFGEAGVHIASDQLQSAAACYDEAAVLAQAIPNLILGIEAYRMGCFCCNRLEQIEAALDRGEKALKVGARLDPVVRNLTSLPLAGIDWLRVIDSERVNQMQNIKAEWEAQVAAIRKDGEQSARNFGQKADPQCFIDLERQLEVLNEEAQAYSRQKLKLKVREAHPSFQNAVDRIDALLGENWLLNALIPSPINHSD